MNRYPITAKNIVSIGYDEAHQILEIEFKLKIIHHYYEVPIDEFITLMKAEDVEGYYFHCILCEYPFDVF